MDIRQLNSYVRERAGAPSPAVLKSDEITLILLSEITARQSQMAQAGKPTRTDIETLIPLTKTGSITFVSGQTGAQTKTRPDLARVRETGMAEWTIIPIASDAEALLSYETSGAMAILLYGEPLVYELSFDPVAHEIELWFDKDVSTLLQISTSGTGLAQQFDFMIGVAATIKAMPRIVQRDETARTWADIQIRVLEMELQRYEADWQQFLYQSATSRGSSRKTPYRSHSSGTRRLRGFPY